MNLTPAMTPAAPIPAPFVPHSDSRPHTAPTNFIVEVQPGEDFLEAIARSRKAGNRGHIILTWPKNRQ